MEDYVNRVVSYGINDDGSWAVWPDDDLDREIAAPQGEQQAWAIACNFAAETGAYIQRYTDI